MPIQDAANLDTAHVVRGVRGIVRIDPRCVACSAKRRVCRQLEKRRGHDVLSGHGGSLRAMLPKSAESPWRLHDRSELFSKMLRCGEQVKSGEKPE
jgi:hypothetical protein